mmetsp:Transcript_133448/g.386280  ORF Transcript_133448/g.386280 Transcript_133448/m.386280 type:complete len:99 (+) Transcript_133448:178-474(+)
MSCLDLKAKTGRSDVRHFGIQGDHLNMRRRHSFLDQSKYFRLKLRFVQYPSHLITFLDHIRCTGLDPPGWIFGGRRSSSRRWWGLPDILLFRRMGDLQ